jgi:flagellar export protein FliJ
VPVSKALRRLLRIRELEEEQCKLALESAVGELQRAEHALTATADQDRRGRLLVETSARSGQLQDRLAGLEECRTAGRLIAVLEPMIAECEIEVTRRREEYLEKRVERRQAETLIRESEAEDAIEDGRRSQQSLDDWFSMRLHRARGQMEWGRGGEIKEVKDVSNERGRKET